MLEELFECLNKHSSCTITLTKKLSYKEGVLEFEARVEANGESGGGGESGEGKQSKLAGFFDSPEQAVAEIERAARAVSREGKGVVEITPNLLEELKKLRANARLKAALASSKTRLKQD